MDVPTAPPQLPGSEHLVGYPFAPHYVDVTAGDTAVANALRRRGRATVRRSSCCTASPPGVICTRYDSAALRRRAPYSFAPHDLIGFGPLRQADSSRTTPTCGTSEWVTSWFENLDLRRYALRRAGLGESLIDTASLPSTVTGSRGWWSPTGFSPPRRGRTPRFCIAAGVCAILSASRWPSR